MNRKEKLTDGEQQKNHEHFSASVDCEVEAEADAEADADAEAEAKAEAELRNDSEKRSKKYRLFFIHGGSFEKLVTSQPPNGLRSFCR